MACRSSILELDAIELLFTALVTGAPPEEYEEQLEAIRSDQCGGDQNELRKNMLLHMAVRSGSVVWVEKLLCLGADALGAKGSSGLTAEEVAQQMCQKHPGNEEVTAVLTMIRLAIARDATVARRLAKLGGEGLLNGSASRLMSHSTLAPSNTSFLLHEFQSLRDVLFKYREEISSEEETKELFSVRQSLSDVIKLLQSFKFSSNGEPTAGANGDQRSLNTSVDIFENSISRIIDEMATLKESMSRLRAEACFLKPLKLELESTIRSLFQMTESVNKLMVEVKQSALERKKEHEVMLQQVNLNLVRRSRQACVDDMMRKTMIINCDDEKLAYVRRLFENLYLIDEVTLSLIKFVHSVPDIKVFVDCDSNTIENIKKQLVNEDGEEVDGTSLRAFGDINMNIVYLGALQKQRSEENVIGCLALSLSKIVIHRLYQNKGLPYATGQSELEQQFSIVINDFIQIKDKLPHGGFMREAAEMKTWIGKCVRLISSVPADMALYKSTGGREFLKKNAPNLLCFFEKQVLEAIL